MNIDGRSELLCHWLAFENHSIQNILGNKQTLNKQTLKTLYIYNVRENPI